jgi:hypothetical protein
MTGSPPQSLWLSPLRRALQGAIAQGRLAFGALLCAWAVLMTPWAHADACDADDADPHTQATLESRYPYTVARYDSPVARFDATPATPAATTHPLSLTPTHPSTHIRVTLAFISGMRLWVGTSLASLSPTPSTPRHTLSDPAEAIDGGMTCEGGQSCASLHDLLTALDRASTQTQPSPRPDSKGPACVIGDPGCDLPVALLDGSSSSSSLDMPWLYLPTPRLSFALRASWPSASPPPTITPLYIAPLGKRLSDRIDRPPRA